jgi:hypothetical protein
LVGWRRSHQQRASEARRARNPRADHRAATDPPERGGGPQQIRIEIEIVDRRAQPRRRSSIGLGFWLLLFLQLALAAHADDQGIHYDHWQDTYGRHGETRTQGSTTDWDAYGPRGEQKHCHRYYVGDTTYTNCH